MSPLAYFRVHADAGFWSTQWQAESLDRLLAVASASELTRFLERHVRSGDRVLEGGCGLGQYVRYFAERGFETVGVDFSGVAIARHKERFPDSDVHVGDLEELAFPDASFDVYLSIGVVEHNHELGERILAEARRVLRPGGRLLLATPYLNVARTALRPVIVARQRRIERDGGAFYQYALTARELDAVLQRSGFHVRSRMLYNPGRGVRDVIELLRRQPERASRAASRAEAATRPHGGLRRRVIYSAPTLRAFAHMQVVCATRSSP